MRLSSDATRAAGTDGMSAVNTSVSDREHEAIRRAQRAHEPSMDVERLVRAEIERVARGR